MASGGASGALPPLDHEIDFDADPANFPFVFGGAAPVATLRSGQILRTATLDCFCGRLRTVHDHASVVCDPRMLNPQTGPFWIEGAVPGDTLAVHFIQIEPREAWGVSTTVPLFGALTGTGLTALLQAPLPELTWIYGIDTAARTVRYEARHRAGFAVDLPLDPMHGTVGVAPDLGEVRSALTPGAWGGNMDTPEMRAGTTCFLGVNVEGALFSFGDGHARQGEGETCGVAVETAMDTVLVIEVLKSLPCPWPRLEDDEHLMTTGSSRPLEDAFRIAHSEMVRWVAELTGLDLMDAYQLVSQVALTPVANVVDTTYTVVAKVPKRMLGLPPAMGGAHSRLRALGAAYQAGAGG